MANQPERKPLPFAESRRRYLAILFADLSSSSQLAGSMEAEDYAELLAKVRRLYAEVIAKHGGTVLQIVGDGIFASFGYPDAHEDDCRRAVEAAVELHDQIRHLKLDFPPPMAEPLRLHTGVHAGLVLLDEGDAVSGPLRLFGNAVNIAARLSDAAASDEILVSKETLGAESHFFEAEDVGDMTLHGIAEPIAVCRIGGRASVGTRLEARAKRGLTPFVGRDAELQALTDRLRDTLAGKPCYVAIVAGAGLGKTRLAEAFLARAAGLDCQIHRGYCESYLSAEPLQPFRQMLRSLCGLDYGISAAFAAEALERRLRDIDPALIAHRPALLRALSLSLAASSEADGGQGAPETPTAALASLFDALAATRPVVLFIDDWQWADDATRQALAAIRKLAKRPIFVLIAGREAAAGDVGTGDAEVVDLMPFTTEETETTIRRLLPGPNMFLTTDVRNYSGGNPLFVEELCHSAANDPANYQSGRTPGGKAWLDKLIEARVERLPAEQFDLVRAAAVIGNVVAVPVFEAITGCRVDDPLVRGLADQDLIYPGEQPGTLRFKHGIARDVIYNAVGLRRRKAMHLRIAEMLRQQVSSGFEEELYEPLAYHYASAGQAEEAAHYAELAGDKAVAASALDRAQLQYLAALAAIDQMQPSEANYRRWMEIVQRLALASVFDPSREQLKVMQRAADLAAAHSDKIAMARTEYWVGYLSFALGDIAASISHLQAGLDLALALQDMALATQLRATLGQAYASASDYDTATALVDKAIAIKRKYRRPDRPAVGLAYTLAAKSSILADQGRFDEAQECCQEALAVIGDSGHEVEGSILCWQSAVLLWQGRWAEARACALKAQHNAQRVKSLYNLAMSHAIGNYGAWKLDGAPASLQAIADATSWLENRKMGLFISLNYGWLADGMAATGEWQAARRYAARALRRSRVRDRIGGAMAYRAMARASAAGQCRKPPDHYLELAMRNALERGSPHEIAATQLCEAEIRLARGERAQADASLDKAEAAFDAMAMTWHAEAARRLRRTV